MFLNWKIKNKKGLSFLEAIIALFIFVIVIVAVTQMFASSFGGYRKAEVMQKNIESVQFAINAMAKSLRTSTIFDSGVSLSAIKLYDHSEPKCKYFSFEGNKVYVRSNSDSLETCKTSNAVMDADRSELASQYGKGSFMAVASDGTSKKMGRVTINFRACSSQDCAAANNDEVILQTTVSLRDYNTVGL